MISFSFFDWLSVDELRLPAFWKVLLILIVRQAGEARPAFGNSRRIEGIWKVLVQEAARVPVRVGGALFRGVYLALEPFRENEGWQSGIRRMWLQGWGEVRRLMVDRIVFMVGVRFEPVGDIRRRLGFENI